MLSHFDGKQFRSQIAELVSSPDVDEQATERLIQAFIPSVERAEVPDFEKALVVGSNMMLDLYPDRWMLRGPQARNNCLPSP